MRIDTMSPTNDIVIREALISRLKESHSLDPKVRIIPELGVQHGSARVDVAVVNGVLHGYEIKSDRDTLLRLPEQVTAYNSVFDEMTLVVGKTHLYEAIHIVPDWWNILIAKTDKKNNIFFHVLREGSKNPQQNRPAVARLLWRDEALHALERRGEAAGMRSKTRDDIYEKLSSVLSPEALGQTVREVLFFRQDWRPGSPLVLNGD
jgi:hypothetical protein